MKSEKIKAFINSGADEVVNTAIKNLIDDGVLDPCLWIGIHEKDANLKPYQRYFYDFNFSWNEKWLDTCADLIAKYKDGVKFNQDIYNKVYKDIYHFSDLIITRSEIAGDVSLHRCLHQFNLLYSFFYALLVKEKVQLCIFSNVPHEGVDFLVYSLAKALDIKVLFFTQAAIPENYYRIFYSDDIEDIGEFKFMKHRYDDAVADIKKTTTEELFYMQPIKIPLRKRFKDAYRKLLLKLGLRKRKRNEKLHNRYLKLLRQAVKEVDYTKNYVYFPLHLQPELTTSALGGIYEDQCLAIERLAEIIPDDWVIYVKENPKQSFPMRSELFFVRLGQMKNVQIVPLEESSIKLIENAKIVATITGTAGYEALCRKKPVIVFGKAFYNNFEGAFYYNNDLNIEEVANYDINLDKLKADLADLLSRCPKTVVDAEYICAIPDFDFKESVDNLAELIRRYIRENFEG